MMGENPKALTDGPSLRDVPLTCKRDLPAGVIAGSFHSEHLGTCNFAFDRFRPSIGKAVTEPQYFTRLLHKMRLEERASLDRVEPEMYLVVAKLETYLPLGGIHPHRVPRYRSLSAHA